MRISRLDLGTVEYPVSYVEFVCAREIVFFP